jgi:hypothetical protein
MLAKKDEGGGDIQLFLKFLQILTIRIQEEINYGSIVRYVRYHFKTLFLHPPPPPQSASRKLNSFYTPVQTFSYYDVAGFLTTP